MKKRSDFLRSAHNLKKKSSWFWRLVSKSADLSKPWGRLFQILCVSQKVRTLPLTIWILSVNSLIKRLKQLYIELGCYPRISTVQCSGKTILPICRYIEFQQHICLQKDSVRFQSINEKKPWDQAFFSQNKKWEGTNRLIFLNWKKKILLHRGTLLLLYFGW